MSKEDIADQINEVKLGDKANSLLALVVAIGVKYGLPSLVCIYLFYVIDQKDRQIFTMSREVTSALVMNNSAIAELAEAVKGLNR